jgi:hypothetical protein
LPQSWHKQELVNRKCREQLFLFLKRGSLATASNRWLAVSKGRYQVSKGVWNWPTLAETLQPEGSTGLCDS